MIPYPIPALASHPLSSEISFAIQTVRQAAHLTLQVPPESVPPESKGIKPEDGSPVTVADFAVQAVLGYLLTQEFPDDPLVAEESAKYLRTPKWSKTLTQTTHLVSQLLPEVTAQSLCDWIDRGTADGAQRFWTLDPVDGTTGFLKGAQYAVALALLENYRVQIGILGCPRLNELSRPGNDTSGSLVVAVRGYGAWSAPLNVNGEFVRLQVSSTSTPTEARLLRSVEKKHMNIKLMKKVVNALGVQAQVPMDSQAKCAVLAAGGGDFLVRIPPLPKSGRPEYREKIWDQAAGSLIVEEAGGRISDIDGQPFDFTAGRTLARNRGVLASNGHLHEAVLQAVRQVGQGNK